MNARSATHLGCLLALVACAGGHRWLRFLSPAWAAAQTAFLLWQMGDPRFQPAPGPSGERR